MKISDRARRMFDYFAQCQDTQRLPRIPFVADGRSALECFHLHETHGRRDVPTREPELLARALNGKAWNGLTVQMVAEDLVACMITPDEVRADYPPVIATDILAAARKKATATIGFVPTFLRAAL